MSANHLKVVLCWHMHQPEYRDLSNGRFKLPWTYLHAIKDYVDMAGLLEEVPGACAVINFVPILLEQIDDYAQRLDAYFTQGETISDPLLAALASKNLVMDESERVVLIRACLRANEERLIARFPAFQKLVDMVNIAMPVEGEDRHGAGYLSEQHMADLLVWYHLAWLGETVRRHDRRIQRLIKKGHSYDYEDRLELLGVIGELLKSLLGRYRRLADQGKVELSMTPYAHPMLPLLIDFNAGREALPDMPLPQAASYPHGMERVHWHFKRGLEVFERYFGKRPRGCWPSEGGVSDALFEVLAEYDFDWLATGESVLRNSLAHMPALQDEPVEAKLHRPYKLQGKGPSCFFRDDGLSDLIGFTYSDWHGDDAVNNLVHHLENIASECPDQGDRVVSIILDGENAWESYPNNGYFFLRALYQRLAEHEDIDLVTFSNCLDQGVKAHSLPHIVAGSWVYGTFSTWMGDKDKNRGWDMLCDAKCAVDEVLATGKLSESDSEKVLEQLAVCEGSDWFWWFGDYNPAGTVSDFEQLYRTHLRNLYKLIHRDPPDYLSKAMSAGSGDPAQGGVMRPGQAAGH